MFILQIMTNSQLYASQHFQACAKCTRIDQLIYHVVMTIFELFPVLGWVIAYTEYTCNSKITSLTKKEGSNHKTFIPKKSTTKPRFSDASSLQPLNVLGCFPKIFQWPIPKYLSPLIQTREDFLNSYWKHHTPAPHIGRSHIVPDWMVEGLMERKRNIAIGCKYQANTWITNMEGAIHTLLVPVAHIKMLGDYFFENGHQMTRFAAGLARNVVLSASIQPDFETSEVMIPISALGSSSIQGEPLDSQYTSFPNNEQKQNSEFRQAYDSALQKHLIYHLTAQHYLPSISQSWPLLKDQAIKLLEQLINSSTPAFDQLQNRFVLLNGRAISLEVLFNLYVEQLKVEFTTLEQTLSNSYIYTIDPPAIFAKEIEGTDGVKILNRLQALAFKKLLSEDPNFAQKLHAIGFNNYADKKLIPLLQTAFSAQKPSVKVKPKSAFFQNKDEDLHPLYSGEAGHALVLHNNSDAFGENIKYEKGNGSLDAMIGGHSNAACALGGQQKNLCKHII